tara:strand:+ start:157 stop:294 length:138 start_codon:yes stop_codon:yes gene_type:complete
MHNKKIPIVNGLIIKIDNNENLNFSRMLNIKLVIPIENKIEKKYE